LIFACYQIYNFLDKMQLGKIILPKDGLSLKYYLLREPKGNLSIQKSGLLNTSNEHISSRAQFRWTASTFPVYVNGINTSSLNFLKFSPLMLEKKFLMKI
jgi:hypothetical protein